MLATSSRLRPQHVLFDFLASRIYATSKGIFSSNHVFRKRYASSFARAERVRPISLNSLEGADYIEVNQALVKLHGAATEDKADVSWTSYGFLVDKGFRNLLTPAHYGPISKMLNRLCHVGQDDRVEKMRPAVEGLALACARAGFYDGLRQLLLYYLARGDANRITDLYETLARNASQTHTGGLETVESEGQSISGTRFTSNDETHSSTRYIIVMVVAAYALKGAFPDALALLLKHPEHRIVPSTVSSALQGTGVPDSLIKTAIEYCQAATNASLAQRPDAFKAHVRNLVSESVAQERLATLTENMLSGYTGPLQWAAVSEGDLSPSHPVLISDRVWAILIKALISVRQNDVAENLWVHLLDFGIVPSIVLWNGLLEAYHETSQTDKLLRTWSVMKEEGIALDCRSYSVVIASLASKGGMTNAQGIFEEFRAVLGDSEESILVYNSVIDIHLNAGNFSAASQLFEQMKGSSPTPDTVTYNIFCKYYGRNNNLKAVAQIVHEMIGSGTQPDVFTFTTLLSTMLRMKVPNAAERMLQVMQSMGVEQNVATYSAIIDAQVREGAAEGIRSAWDILQSMETMGKAQPNEITYTSLLIGVHRSKEISADLITSITEDVVRKMHNRRIRLKRGMYHVLMKTCLENPRKEALHFFRWYYSEMMRKKVPFAHDTWYIILQGLLKRNQHAMANEMVDDMLRSGFQPMGGVLKMVREIREWRA